MSVRTLRYAAIAMAALSGITGLGAALAAQEASSEQPTHSVWDGIYTEEQARRGESLYWETCASCHGPDLMGGEMAPPLLGGEFVWNWNGLSMGKLFGRILVSMPPDRPRSVSREQKADILAFVLYMNEFPIGDTELANRIEILNQIAFNALKPGGGAR